jgi:olefin beta-lactone synthetase
VTVNANIVELLRAQAARVPDRLAIVDRHRGRERAVSFAQLETLSGQAAALLASRGLCAGQTVLVFQPMSVELYAVLLGIFRLGLVAMVVDPAAGRDHLEQCCAIRPPDALVASTKAHLLRLISPALRRIPRQIAIGPLEQLVPFALPWSRAARLAPHEAIHQSHPDAPALLTFTSGSTGQPKAAVRTHGLLRTQHAVLERTLRAEDGEINLATLPIFALANLASGTTSLIPAGNLRRPGEVDPAPILQQLASYPPASVVASPAFLDRLGRYVRRRGATMPSFRRLFAGGAPVFPRFVDEWLAVAPQAEVISGYGSTEAEPIAELSHTAVTPADRAAMRQGGGLLAGQPVPEVTLRILPDRWGEPIGPYTAVELDRLVLPSGEIGEIAVAGPHVLRGYLDGRGDEETKFRVDGTVWHRTGDAGYLDAGGRLWLMGRCAAKIEDARGRLYPFAVECAAMEDPAVRRAAVIAHAGRRLLLLERYDGADEEPSWLEQLSRSLAWANLDIIRLCRRIPVDRRHNAKIDYPALRRLLSNNRDAAAYVSGVPTS